MDVLTTKQDAPERSVVLFRTEKRVTKISVVGLGIKDFRSAQSSRGTITLPNREAKTMQPNSNIDVLMKIRHGLGIFNSLGPGGLNSKAMNV